MAYPTTLDNLSGTRGTDAQPLNAPNHVTHHLAEDTAIQALETKVGVDGSAVTTTHDYKLSSVATGDKAMSKTGTETATNKTFTDPKITAGVSAKGDMLQLSAADGTLAAVRATAQGDIISWNASTSQWETIANPAAADASTTVKGVVEEATQAEVDAATAAGGTNARLFQNPSTIRARLLNTGVADTGAANAYVITPVPAITAYATYQEFTFVATNANTGPSTLAVSGLTTKAITKNGTDALIGGEIVAGQATKVIYDGTRFQLASPVSTGSSFTRLATLTISQSVSSGVLTKVGEFTGLTGNTDDEYLVEFELNNSAVAGDNTHYLVARLNDDSGSNYSTGLAGMKSGAVAYNQSGLAATSGTLARSDTSFPANLMFGSLKIKASTTIAGAARCIISNVSISNGSVGIIFNGNINWSDASNQITSVQLYVQQSSGSPDTVTGKASIYKISR